jgi:spore maturation protein CgeB
LPERCYGIPACGGFLLADERAHAKDDFICGEEIVMFRDLDDCLQKILFYRGSLAERRRIAENAYRRVLKDHTYVQRAEKLIAAIKTGKDRTVCQ